MTLRRSKRFAGASAPANAAEARLIETFRAFLTAHKAEIAALRLLDGPPYRRRLTAVQLDELAERLRRADAGWTEDKLWEAFADAAPGRVEGRPQARRPADLVPLVRFALGRERRLEPFARTVERRFIEWLEQNISKDVLFGDEQRAWLELIRDRIADRLRIDPEDLDATPFAERGGRDRARRLFGAELPALLEELNEALTG